MEIKVKPKAIVAVVLVVAILVGGYFYMKKTAPKRAYKRELRQLRLIEEHQRLEIAVVKQRATLQAMNKAAVPTVNLPQVEPEAKRQANK